MKAHMLYRVKIRIIIQKVVFLFFLSKVEQFKSHDENLTVSCQLAIESFILVDAICST